MGIRVKWDLGDEPDDSALDTGGIYTGDTPPKGMYRCRVMGGRVKPDKNNDPRVNFWIEIQETKPEKKEFSGYRFYDGQAIAQREIQQKIWKQIANALGVGFKDITTKSTLSKELAADGVSKDLEKFAGVPVDKLPRFNALCKVTSYQGNERLEIIRWLPLAEADDDGDDDDEAGDDGDGDAPF